MSNEPQTTQIADTVESMTESLLPILLPFDPLIKMLVNGIIRAHYNATRTWPTPAEVQAALPHDWQALVGTWASWTPSGR